MGQFFDVGHVAQLHEIQKARLSRGELGIATEVEELIVRLTSGGVGAKSADLRRNQAKQLWDKGFGREIDINNFKAYLADIPKIPQSLLANDAELPFLSLADPRVGLVKACHLIGTTTPISGTPRAMLSPLTSVKVIPRRRFGSDTTIARRIAAVVRITAVMSARGTSLPELPSLAYSFICIIRKS